MALSTQTKLVAIEHRPGSVRAVFESQVLQDDKVIHTDQFERHLESVTEKNRCSNEEFETALNKSLVDKGAAPISREDFDRFYCHWEFCKADWPVAAVEPEAPVQPTPAAEPVAEQASVSDSTK